ncbi:hypothetical protein CDD82_2539 [Ophiocordyceps australis]|uniref:Uncharacterized protein n=1 Tax=Ophiocordyceps australis TaxID=1399860 RepID=A0A2C5ZBD9_9HYPO|nr:hypothetical protein CDD82_2539 [Ophiocordyceps australis]
MPTSAWASLARRFTPSNAIPIRSFSTTPPRLRKTFIAHQIPSRIVPPYPYGYRQVYKQSNKGLYGSARIRFGNTVSEKWNRKSRRSWSPNVIVKIFKSPSLKARFRARLTIPTLKTIYHEGGIENYLLKSKAARIKDLGPAGWRLRWLLMQTKAVQHRFNEQRKAMGLEEKPIVDNDHVINYALDCACQGRLSLHNRAIHAQRPNMDTIFLGGDEPLSNAQNAEEFYKVQVT